DSPTHFRHLVAIGCERKNRVVIRHRNRISVPKSLHTQSVCFEYPCVGRRRVGLHPLEKCGANIEAHLCIQIVAMLDRTVWAENSRLCHWRVAFIIDTLIPVVERRSAWLRVYLSGPGIFARRLVEMAMHYN